jgi:hypothetical protein
MGSIYPRFGFTSTSSDPVVATLFGTTASRHGKAMVQIIPMDKFAGRVHQSLDDFANPQELLASLPIQLRVQAIEAYRRTLDELSGGMTGTLVVSGDGIKQISPDSVLEGVAGDTEE